MLSKLSLTQINLSFFISILSVVLLSAWVFAAEQLVFPVPPPPLSEDYFPCSDCHEGQETNFQRRELEEEHDDIELRHAEQLRWCLDCHYADDRDKLHLQNGDKIEFSESYLLCGQCHGTKFRDWRAGVHGKRTGFWNGRKEYLLCAHCHNPHDPKFKSLKPEPPPAVPREWP